jgi:hypothetical protein
MTSERHGISSCRLPIGTPTEVPRGVDGDGILVSKKGREVIPCLGVFIKGNPVQEDDKVTR